MHCSIEIDIPSGVLLSVFHFQGSTFFRALVNSHSDIGKLFSELYHLVFTPWRETAAEEHFLSPRTLLLHMYSAVALIRLKHYTTMVGAVGPGLRRVMHKTSYRKLDASVPRFPQD
jgi:hypothetical protein